MLPPAVAKVTRGNFKNVTVAVLGAVLGEGGSHVLAIERGNLEIDGGGSHAAGGIGIEDDLCTRRIVGRV
jgi:hypothetical protein